MLTCFEIKPDASPTHVTDVLRRLVPPGQAKPGASIELPNALPEAKLARLDLIGHFTGYRPNVLEPVETVKFRINRGISRGKARRILHDLVNPASVIPGRTVTLRAKLPAARLDKLPLIGKFVGKSAHTPEGALPRKLAELHIGAKANVSLVWACLFGAKVIGHIGQGQKVYLVLDHNAKVPTLDGRAKALIEALSGCDDCKLTLV